MSRRETIQRHLEQRALFELARYGQYVGAVRMRVSGRGPSSEQPYHCGIAVTVVHDDGTSRHVLARSWGSDVFHLIDSVLGRAASLVGGEVGQQDLQGDRLSRLDVLSLEHRRHPAVVESREDVVGPTANHPKRSA